MELKDIVLSTLAEIDKDMPLADDENLVKEEDNDTVDTLDVNNIKEEQFLKNLRERILVLFEGFKSPNTQNIEAKLDLTLNFLEYLLSSIDERLNDYKK
jgi:hypothetical protein